MDRKIIADTSGIIAFLDRDDQYHSSVVKIFQQYQIYVPITVLPEVDYLATKYLGEKVARSFIEDLGEGYFEYLEIDVESIYKVTKLMAKYKDLPLGFVDASIVVLAEYNKIKQILTLDRRHFNLIQTETVNFFHIFP
ncbi:PIN domain-containing protein [Cyanobacterium aponinum FACHB-4101]|uniref:type II toxin-antitoxin system VapC family toxin n=1 Tax=Cyanobacterium TaxID=102234 RepID=UPI0016812DD4|nr:PIN domain-containing protein [Cyanobacterium sp. Dongsha4]MBD2392986.1 PIN domain-containing protein [Cyanobacterium aponinum FACHB-4101]WVL00341.1 PIN domain-containing protein [Cyanobacterium sp. Dongsha4]